MPTRSGDSTAPRSVLALRNIRVFLGLRLVSGIAIQLQSVAVAWQVYDLTRDPLSLGLVGLAQFLPMAGLILAAGDLADRYDRRLILALAYCIQCLCAALFLMLTLLDPGTTWPFYLILALFGAARALGAPAGQSLLPLLVPPALFPTVVAWGSSAHQIATVIGPALGGAVFVFGAAAVYAVCTVSFAAVSAGILLLRVPFTQALRRVGGSMLRRVLTGLAFLRNAPLIKGAILLDMFAVLLGGATALLPVYARDILLVGPEGLGFLRSAPAVGASAVALLLALFPLRRHAGIALLSCVALFGVATIAFGLSHNFALSLAALVVLGAADMVSVYVRSTLVQLATPDHMRGRISAVSMLFIGASNELGEFESGVTAAWFGTVPAVVIGGVGTLIVVGFCAALIPALRKVDRLAEVRPS